MKIYILGYGAKNRGSVDPFSGLRINESVGKDTLAEYLRDKLGLSFESSSYFCAKHFLFDKFKEEYGYTTIEQCFNDRHSPGMRKKWYDAICELNKEDKTFVSSEIFRQHDLYIGLRSKDEFLAAKKRWPDVLSFWIDSSDRVEPEGVESCSITAEMCDFTIHNNGTIQEYQEKMEKVAMIIKAIES